MTKVTVSVKGMSCAHCEARVNKAVLELAGVSSCKASAKKSEAVVKFDEGAIDLAAVKAAIIDVGYEVE